MVNDGGSEQGSQEGHTELAQQDERTTEETLGRRHRQKHSSIRLHDCVTHTIQKVSPSNHSPVSQYPPRMPYPIAHHVSCDKFLCDTESFLQQLLQIKFLAAITAN